MSETTAKMLVHEVSGKLIPQAYDPVSDTFQALNSVDGATSVTTNYYGTETSFETADQGTTVANVTSVPNGRVVEIGFYNADLANAALPASNFLYVSFNAADGSEQTAVDTAATRYVIPLGGKLTKSFTAADPCTKISYKADAAPGGTTNTLVAGSYSV